MKFTSWLVFFSGMLFFSTCLLSALVTPSTFLTIDGLDQRFSILRLHLVGISDLILVFATTFSTTTISSTICGHSFLEAVARNVTLFLASETNNVGILSFICSRSWGSSSSFTSNCHNSDRTSFLISSMSAFIVVSGLMILAPTFHFQVVFGTQYLPW